MATYNLTDAVRKLIIYYRVSTKRQGDSGLGLEGQATAVAQYVAAYGGQAERLELGRDVIERRAGVAGKN